MLSSGIHFLHLWHLPSSISDFSFLAATRATTRNASGGENGSAEAEDIPADETTSRGLSHELKNMMQRRAVPRTMIVLHVVAASKHAKPISIYHGSKDSMYSAKIFSLLINAYAEGLRDKQLTT